MRNLVGYLKKTLLLFSTLLLFFSFFIKDVNAVSDFQIYSNFTHKITSSEVNTEIILQIRTISPRVLTYYTASIPVRDIYPQCFNARTNKKIECTKFDRGSNTDLLFNLGNSVIRENSPLELKIIYTQGIKNNNSYNISSKVLDSTTKNIAITYPKEYGEPLWSSDQITSLKIVQGEYIVTFTDPVYPNTSLLFGKNIYYKFTATRVLQNSNNENQTFEVILPPDTQSQTILWGEISPLPNTTVIDDDGNYIFKYILPPSKSIDIKITGHIKKNSPTKDEDIQDYLTKEFGYWNIVNNSEHKRIITYMNRSGLKIDNTFESVNKLSNSEKDLFYKYIYKYVVEKLGYDKNITLGVNNTTRLGANTMTENSTNVNAIDYVDFYIALLRKYHIPSRLIIGYVSNVSGYTSDGFYHYWVEYYDSVSKKWVTSDPFLEDYTKKELFGSDFYDHITLISRGKSTLSPNLTFYNSNDFKIEYTKEDPQKIDINVDTDLTFEKFKSTDKFLKGYIYLTNKGNIALTKYLIPKTNIDSLTNYIDPINNINSTIILPGQSTSMQINIPYNKVLAQNVFLTLNLKNNSNLSKDFLLEEKIVEIVPIYITILSKIISLTLFTSTLFLIYFLIRRWRTH